MRHLLLPWITGVLVGSLSLAHASPAREEKATQHYQRAEAVRRAGRFEEAISGYRQTLQGFPEHPLAFDRLREIYNRIHAFAVTRELLEATVARQEDDFVAWNLLGVLYGRDRRWDEALQAFARSRDAEPLAADALVNDLGWLSYKMNRYPEAVAALEKAAALDPKDPMIETNLGLAYQKAGRG